MDCHGAHAPRNDSTLESELTNLPSFRARQKFRGEESLKLENSE